MSVECIHDWRVIQVSGHSSLVYVVTKCSRCGEERTKRSLPVAAQITVKEEK